MSIYVHSPSPYFIVKEWLARILLLLLLQKKKTHWKFSFTRVWPEKMTPIHYAADIDQSGR